MIRLFRRLACALAVLLFIAPVSAFADTWAICMYICGSDLESQNGAASTDLAEFDDADLNDSVQIYFEIGGASRWMIDDFSANRLQLYSYTNKDLKLIRDMRKASMAAPSTLAKFLSFCRDEVRADHKILILWDHGGGSVHGFGSDESYGDQSMSLEGLNQAFRQVFGEKPSRPPFEIIGFDACLMATIDTVAAVQPYGRYFVGTQNLEPGVGWNYTEFPDKLAKKNTMSGADVGRLICDTYLKGCKKTGEHMDATLSLIDLRKVPALLDAYNALGLEAVTKVSESEDFYTTLGRLAKRSENYYNSRSTGYTDMVDMGSLTGNLKKQLPMFSEIAQQALQNAVIYKVSGPSLNPSGLSVYYPLDGDEDSYRLMFNTSNNVTSFLILNGLQFGFIDGDQAVSILQDITSTLDQAVANMPDGGEPSGQGQSQGHGQSQGSGHGSSSGSAQGSGHGPSQGAGSGSQTASSGGQPSSGQAPASGSGSQPIGGGSSEPSQGSGSQTASSGQGSQPIGGGDSDGHGQTPASSGGQAIGGGDEAQEIADSFAGLVGSFIGQPSGDEEAGALSGLAQAQSQGQPIGASSSDQSATFAGSLGTIQHAVNPAGTHDITDLEDHPIEVEDDVGAVLRLEKDELSRVDSVHAYLCYYSEDKDLIVILGRDSNIKRDWDNGVFTDNFEGSWAAIDGHYVYLEATSETHNFYRYDVPVKLNGKRANLEVVYDRSQDAYIINGARMEMQNNMPARELIKLKPGDKITPILMASSISGDDDFKEYDDDTFTLADGFKMETTDLGDGDFIYMFELSDFQNNSATTQMVSINVKGDNMEYEVLDTDSDEDSGEQS
ncbi:MAG: clostripain-related cysteine peptidase [Succinivibrio sp.]|nr:clostripain-related cysteine peptidase [Succinivibrio sp.]